MRILLDARTAQEHFPGIGRYVCNLAAGLAAQLDGELILLAPGDAANARYDLAALGQRPNVRVIPTDIPVFDWREQKRLPGLIRSLRPDVVHFPYNVRPFRLGLPSVLTLYDVIPRLYPAYFGAINRLRIELVQRLALRASTSFVAISRATAHDFARLYGVAPERITITPLAADPIFRPQPPDAVARVRSRLHLPARYLLYVGSNKPHKNLPRLIEAYHRLPASSPPPLILAGASDARYPEARRRVEALNLGERVRFLGSIADADLPGLYAGAELFVMPSLYEGFGLPVAEAMACGAAVACSRTSSLPETAGDAALYFDPTDVGSIASALARALADADLRDDLRQRGRAQAARFTWERTAAATIAAYENVTRNQ